MEIERNENIEDFVISEKRHRELIKTLKELNLEVPEMEIDLSALEKIKDAIEVLLTKKEPVVNVNSNQDEVIEAIKTLNENFTKAIDDLKATIQESKNKEFEFDIERNQLSGTIRKVTAKSK